MIVEQGNVTSGTNMVDIPTLYNYAISPARNMMRWFKTIAAGLVDYTTDLLSFTTGLSNVFASGTNSNSCVIEGNAISENQNISFTNFANSSDATPLWKPIYVTFKYPLSWQQFVSLQSNSKGVIAFSRNSTTFEYGYIVEVNYKPNDGLATFKLLLS
jgi:hypothetical protein